MAQSTPQHANEPDTTDATSPGATGNDLSPNDEDIIEPLGDVEALELVEFNPTVEPEGEWIPPQPVLAYLKKHFTKSLDQAELDKVVKEFSKPQCSFLETPMLKNQVRDHLKKKGKDPHFGVEKTLYGLQGSVLNLTGPLTGLWTDLLDTNQKISREEIILLLQRVIFMVAGLSHSITQERRQIAWSRLNPVIKDISMEDTKKEKGATWFGENFMEKAANRMEEEKALAKFTSSPKESPAPKRRKYTQDPTDLHYFLEKGAPTQHSGGKFQRQQPYNQAHNRTQSFKRPQPQQQTRPPRKQSRQYIA